MLIVSVSTALIAAMFSTRAINNRFDDYLEQEEARYAEQSSQYNSIISELLGLHYAATGSWPGNIGSIAGRISEVIGYPIVLTDSRGNTLVDTSQGPFIDAGRYSLGPSILDDGQIIGTVRVDLPAPQPEIIEEENAYKDYVSQSLTLAVIISASISIVVMLLLSHPILHTIEALTNAADHIATKRRGQRVSVRARGEIGRLARAFNQMADSLARTERLRRGMVADIAHELRTPLSNLRGYMEALRDGVVPPDGGLFTALHDQVLLLNRLVDDLQDLAQADAGQLKLECQSVDLCRLISTTVDGLRSQAAQSGITLDADLPDESLDLFVDEARVAQMLLNLLKNAIAYTPSGGHITVRLTCESRQVSIAVVDTGQGIPAEHLPHVFERFYRADPSRARSTGGSGLGLAIVKQLAEAHGGAVQAQSVPGGGSTFSFALPLGPARAGAIGRRY